MKHILALLCVCFCLTANAQDSIWVQPPLAPFLHLNGITFYPGTNHPIKITSVLNEEMPPLMYGSLHGDTLWHLFSDQLGMVFVGIFYLQWDNRTVLVAYNYITPNEQPFPVFKKRIFNRLGTHRVIDSRQISARSALGYSPFENRQVTLFHFGKPISLQKRSP